MATNGEGCKPSIHIDQAKMRQLFALTGFTYTEMAKRAHVGRGTISRIFTTNVTELDTLSRMVIAFNERLVELGHAPVNPLDLLVTEGFPMAEIETRLTDDLRVILGSYAMSIQIKAAEKKQNRRSKVTPAEMAAVKG